MVSGYQFVNIRNSKCIESFIGSSINKFTCYANCGHFGYDIWFHIYKENI